MLGQLWNTNTILLDLYVYAITQDAVISVKKEDFVSHMVGKTQDAKRILYRTWWEKMGKNCKLGIINI
jgi:hypothetical protein